MTAFTNFTELLPWLNLSLRVKDKDYTLQGTECYTNVLLNFSTTSRGDIASMLNDLCNTSEPYLFNTSLNSSCEEIFPQVPYQVNFMLRLYSLLIIFVNVVSSCCLFTHKKLYFPRSLWYHLVALTINDLIVGLTTLGMSLTNLELVQTNYGLCAFILSVYLIAQEASLNNIFCICAYRFKVIHSIYRRSTTNPKWNATLALMISWTVSILGGLCPYFFLPYKDERIIPHCSPVTAIGPENIQTGSAIAFFNLVSPLVLTDVAYALSIFYLHKTFTSISNGDRSSRMTLHTMEKRVLSLIGILLVLVNIVSLPTICVSSMHAFIAGFRMTKSVRVPMFTMISLNSLINPFVYTLRLKAFKIAIRSNLEKLSCKICRTIKNS